MFNNREIWKQFVLWFSRSIGSYSRVLWKKSHSPWHALQYAICNAYFFSEMETMGWNESLAAENSDGSSVACGKSCIYELLECCRRQRHEGSLICSSFSYFFKWGFKAKNGKWSSQGHSLTRTQIWVFKTTALFIPLLDDFDPSKLIKLANLPLFNIPPLFKDKPKYLSKEGKKHQESMPLVSVCNVKETKKSLPYHPLALSYASRS